MQDKDTAQTKGRIFEQEIAKEFSLYTTPASGAVWYSKLDAWDLLTRWSCKFTEKESYRLTKKDIDEAIAACQGPGGDGSLPLWAIRLQVEKYDLIIMRKEDFKLLLSGDLEIEKKVSKHEVKRRRSQIPILLREEKDA